MSSPTSMMICAAGLGKRLQPITSVTPKPLVKLGGITLLEYNIYYFSAHGVKHFIINAHHLAEQVQEKISSLANIFPELEFTYIYEPELLETGGGVLNALPHFAEQNPLFIANSDGVLIDKLEDNSVSLLTNTWDSEAMDILLLAYPTHRLINISMPGDFVIDENGYVRFAKADLAITNPNYIYSGVMLMKPELFGQMQVHKFSLLELMLKPEVRVRAVTYNGDWLHISDLPSYEAAEKYICGSL